MQHCALSTYGTLGWRKRRSARSGEIVAKEIPGIDDLKVKLIRSEREYNEQLQKVVDLLAGDRRGVTGRRSVANTVKQVKTCSDDLLQELEFLWSNQLPLEGIYNTLTIHLQRSPVFKDYCTVIKTIAARVAALGATSEESAQRCCLLPIGRLEGMRAQLGDIHEELTAAECWFEVFLCGAVIEQVAQILQQCHKILERTYGEHYLNLLDHNIDSSPILESDATPPTKGEFGKGRTPSKSATLSVNGRRTMDPQREHPAEMRRPRGVGKQRNSTPLPTQRWSQSDAHPAVARSPQMRATPAPVGEERPVRSVRPPQQNSFPNLSVFPLQLHKPYEETIFTLPKTSTKTGTKSKTNRVAVDGTTKDNGVNSPRKELCSAANKRKDNNTRTVPVTESTRKSERGSAVASGIRDKVTRLERLGAQSEVTKSSDAPRLSPKSSDAPRLSPKSSDAPRLSPKSSDAPRLSPKSSDAPRLYPKSRDAPRLSPTSSDASRLSPKSSDAPRLYQTSSDAPRLSPMSSDAPRLSPTSSDASRPSPNSNDAPRLSPTSSDAPRLSPKSSDAPRLSPKSSDAPRLSPKSRDAPRLSPTSSDASRLFPKSSDAPRLSPKSSDAPRLSPTSSEASRLSPKSSDAPRLSPTSSDVSRLSPKSSDAPRLSPTSSDASRLSPKSSDASRLSPKPSDASRLSPKSSDASRLSPKSSDASRLSPKSSDASRPSPKSPLVLRHRPQEGERTGPGGDADAGSRRQKSEDATQSFGAQFRRARYGVLASRHTDVRELYLSPESARSSLTTAKTSLQRVELVTSSSSSSSEDDDDDVVKATPCIIVERSRSTSPSSTGSSISTLDLVKVHEETILRAAIPAPPSTPIARLIHAMTPTVGGSAPRHRAHTVGNTAAPRLGRRSAPMRSPTTTPDNADTRAAKVSPSEILSTAHAKASEDTPPPLPVKQRNKNKQTLPLDNDNIPQTQTIPPPLPLMVCNQDEITAPLDKDNQSPTKVNNTEIETASTTLLLDPDKLSSSLAEDSTANDKQKHDQITQNSSDGQDPSSCTEDGTMQTIEGIEKTENIIANIKEPCNSDFSVQEPSTPENQEPDYAVFDVNTSVVQENLGVSPTITASDTGDEHPPQRELPSNGIRSPKCTLLYSFSFRAAPNPKSSPPDSPPTPRLAERFNRRRNASDNQENSSVISVVITEQTMTGASNTAPPYENVSVLLVDETSPISPEANLLSPSQLPLCPTCGGVDNGNADRRSNTSARSSRTDSSSSGYESCSRATNIAADEEDPGRARRGSYYPETPHLFRNPSVHRKTERLVNNSWHSTPLYQSYHFLHHTGAARHTYVNVKLRSNSFGDERRYVVSDPASSLQNSDPSPYQALHVSDVEDPASCPPVSSPDEKNIYESVDFSPSNSTAEPEEATGDQDEEATADQDEEATADQDEEATADQDEESANTETECSTFVHHNKISKRLDWCSLQEVKDCGILDRLTLREKGLYEAKYELITSKVSYLKSLTLMQTVYMDSEALCSVTSAEVHELLFGYLLELKRCSEHFLADLLSGWPRDVCLGEMLMVVEKYANTALDVYVQYCATRMQSMEKLNELKRTDKKFRAVLKKLDSEEILEGHHLESFLILPVQRITRFPLLIHAIMSRLLPEDPERERWQAVHDQLAKVASECNEAVRDPESAQKTKDTAAQRQSSRGKLAVQKPNKKKNQWWSRIAKSPSRSKEDEDA